MEIDVNKLRDRLRDAEVRRTFQHGRVTALASDERMLALAAWKDRIERIHVPDETAVEVQKEINHIIQRSLKREGEGSCTLLHARTGAGKSHMLNRLLKSPSLAPTEDEFGPICPLVYVRAPSPCNLKTLGRVIYKKLTDAELRASTDPHEVWRLLCYQLYGQRVSIIAIDEFHHVLVNPRIDVRQAIVNTIKSLIQPDPMNAIVPNVLTPYPMQVLLSGVPLVDRVVRMDGELSRRTTRIAIEPLAPTRRGLDHMRAFLKAVEKVLGFAMPSDLSGPEMTRRFMAASHGYQGRAMHLIKEASFRAIDEGAPCIDRIRHLGAVLSDITGVDPEANPFIVADASQAPPIREKEWDDLTRLRGKQDAADVVLEEGD